MTQWPSHLFMIGCGNMAGAMLSRWLDSGLDPASVTVFRPSGKPVAPGVEVVSAAPDTLPLGTMVLLGMKPQQISAVADSFAKLLGADILLVSMLAGTTTTTLRDYFPAPENVVRVMPNTPVGVGQGVCALYADSATAPDARDHVADMMQPLGLVEWVEDENAFNLVTALSGCGPAYLFRFIDALAKAGEAIGLEPVQSARLALATVQGASTLATQASESPAALADRVASPGGMTRKGMDVLDQDDALNRLLADTLIAARDRGIEMAEGK
ncbi:pyrroline-5-carboxylate reductase [Sphingobium sp. SCG-1]|uniref:pyrroline-5-carboxylate reductase n=1 Tax=Sphingobium sp. SCG-1 TaxID=2072936 RepID=UPI000CD67B6E|nr:pyrroline-5-carboxylate reductase [Sphingobium sp. SCG-1]AUW58293.1 pyrroline-5-carboxylate reductase [Sphingobium sp. SCG-1]